MTSTTSSTPTAQLHPLGGQYVSRSEPASIVGSYTGSSASSLDTVIVGSFVSTGSQRNLAVGRYTRSQRRGVSAWTTAIRTRTGAIVTRRIAA